MGYKNISGKGECFMNPWMDTLLRFKMNMLVYFGSGTFLCVFLDWVWLHSGTVRITLLLQVFAASVAASLIQSLFGLEKEGEYPAGKAKKRIVVHFATMFCVMLLLGLIFAWIPAGVAGIVLFTLVFVILYAGMFFLFSAWTASQKRRLNERLAEYKSGFER